MNYRIPTQIQTITKTLIDQGFETYLVGGCVRDLLLNRKPKDWDITTNATPEQIQDIFPKSLYQNQFGTVSIYTKAKDPSLRIVEVTTFRRETKYSDKRHPDKIESAESIEEDLSRRDFTINAMALKIQNPRLESQTPETNVIDPFEGQKDLNNKLIRAVGDPNKRFQEDALRLIRAVRFATELNFSLDQKTAKAIQNSAPSLEHISQERIRDELIKILKTKNAHTGISQLHKLGLLTFILPELEKGVEVTQNKHHQYTVFEHNLHSLEYAAKEDYTLEVRLAALLHDIGKPKTKRGKGPDATFYNHQVVGEKMVRKILTRLRFPRALVNKTALLVREHMFVYDPEAVTLAGVRRLLRRVGRENIYDLLKLRQADRIGSGVPKAQPYRLRELKAMLEKVQTDPIDPSMLKIGGNEIMQLLKIKPGPKVGHILAILLDTVLENPDENEPEELRNHVIELGQLSEEKLKKLASKAKMSALDAQKRIDEAIRKRHFV